MSLVRVEEPRVDIHDEKSQVVKMGGQTYLYETVVANSSSTSQSRFDYTPASTNTIIDRRILLRQEVEFTFDEPVELGVNDAPKAYPLNNGLQDIAVQINGTKLSTQPEQYLHAFRCYGNDAETRNRFLSTSPAMPDAWQNYSDWATLDGVGGSNRNPLAGYGEVGAELSRGGFRPSFVSVDKRTVRYVFTEPLYISPLQFDKRNEMGLTNISKLIINLRWADRLGDRMWAHSSLGQPISSVSVAFPSQTELLITAITPNLLHPPMPVINYAYLEPQTFIRDVNAVAPSATRTVISDSVKLAQVPDSVLLFARRSRSSSTFLTADTFARLSKVIVYWNNRVILSGATSQQLYHIARKNGYNGNYAQWNNYSGGALMLDLASDVGLSDAEAPGVRTQATIRVEVEITNPTEEAIDYEFYMVPVMSGIVSVSENSMLSTLGNLSKEAVLESQSMPEAKHNEIHVMEGNGFFGGLKHFINRASRVVQKVAPIARVATQTFAPQLTHFVDDAAKVAGTVRQHTGGGMGSRRALLSRRR